jgi:hypothetical protein
VLSDASRTLVRGASALGSLLEAVGAEFMANTSPKGIDLTALPEVTTGGIADAGVAIVQEIVSNTEPNALAGSSARCPTRTMGWMVSSRL